MIKKILAILILSVFGFNNIVFGLSGGGVKIGGIVEVDYAKTKLKDKKVLKAIEESTKVTQLDLRRFFFLNPYNYSSRAFDHIPLEYAISPTIFNKAYNVVKLIKDTEMPYFRNKKDYDKEYSYYLNGVWKNNLKNINKTYFENIEYTMNGGFDSLNNIKRNQKYSPIINNNNKLNYSVYTQTEIEGKDWLKNKIGINNSKCYDYKSCAQKAFIGNNGDNLSENDVKNISNNTLFTNNIRSLSLNQAENFLWDFFFTDIIATFRQITGNEGNQEFIYGITKSSADNENILPSNQKNLYNKSKEEILEWKESHIVLDVVGVNLKDTYFNITELLNRYFDTTFAGMIQYIVNVDKEGWYQVKNYLDDFKKLSGIQSNNIFLKKGTNKSMIAAFVSDIDLPSVYVGKKYNIGELEEKVYGDNKWIYDEIYTNNGVWSEGYTNINAMRLSDYDSYYGQGSPRKLINGFSIPELKYMNETKDFGIYNNYRLINDKYTMVGIKFQSNFNNSFKGTTVSIKYFPQYINSMFKLELENDSNTIKNVINNKSSFYNELINVVFYNKYPSSIKKNTLRDSYLLQVLTNPTYLTGDFAGTGTGGVNLGDYFTGDAKIYTSKKETGYNIGTNNATGLSLSFYEDNLEEYLSNIKRKFEYLTNLKIKLTNKIKELDNETFRLYQEVKNNPTDTNYKKFIDKYAEQILYSSLASELRKIYYPTKLAVEYNIPGDIRRIDAYTITSGFSYSMIITKKSEKNKLYKETYNRLLKLYDNLHSYHYTRKINQMKKDSIYGLKLGKEIASINYRLSNLPLDEQKAIRILHDTIRKYRTEYKIANYADRINKEQNYMWRYFTFFDYDKYEKIVKRLYSDSKYLKSNGLSTVASYLTNLGVNHNLRSYYNFAQIYGTSELIPNMFDFSIDNSGWGTGGKLYIIK